MERGLLYASTNLVRHVVMPPVTVVVHHKVSSAGIVEIPDGALVILVVWPPDGDAAINQVPRVGHPEGGTKEVGQISEQGVAKCVASRRVAARARILISLGI